MPAPQKILELVAHFREASKHKMVETVLRQQFLDKFFVELGWDVTNDQHKVGREMEVDMEQSIETREGRTEHKRAPDYSFRVDGKTKFFVEAKKPSVDIHDGIGPAYQVRRYGWSAKLGISILTDFEEFAVYDCRVKPKAGDKASVARKFYCTFEEYAEKWDEIATIFSREAVVNGKLEEYAGAKKQKGVVAVNDDFLATIESWRDELARNLAVRNPELSQDELNFAVTKIIDRIIFLRIAEDRNIEPEGTLQRIAEREETYAELKKLFLRADTKYNSGLFHFKVEKGVAEGVDAITPKLQIDDVVLKKIIRELYYPQSEYEFSVMPADILGQVYEQFLGKVIRLTDGHRAKVEEKPEVRKAGGVYYTPEYIVEYIVRNTVGKLCENKTPNQIAELKIVDPACGSGSFLIGAYQYLLDWHLAYYTKHKTHADKLESDKHGNKQLKIEERKRILLNNIYGVDIDANAVEVTKLSLLLKTLEGEIKQQLWDERMLPDLASNIKCGNSLIGSDFYNQQSFAGMDAEGRKRVNVFDWESAFPEVFKNGGFDAVIGNPPYLNIDDTWGKGDIRLQAIKSQYPAIYNDKTDILFYFLGKAVKISNNYVSFIVSRAFLEAYKGDKLRKYLSEKTNLKEIVDFQDFHIFEGVGISTCIVNFQLQSKTKTFDVYKLLLKKLPNFELEKEIEDKNIFEHIKPEQKKLTSAPWSFVSSQLSEINAKIDTAGDPLEQILKIGKGMETGKNNVFGELSWKEIQDWKLPKNLFFKRASNSDIQRFFIKDRGELILYPEDLKSFSELPKATQDYLQENSAVLKERAAFKRGNCEWWKFTWPLHKEYYNRKKILCPYLAKLNRFALDEKNEFLSLTDTTVLFENNQSENLLYLLGILNSKLLTFRFKSIGKLKGGGIYEYFWNSISKLPIKRIDFSNPTEKSQHDRIVSLVDHMLALNKALASATLPHDRDSLTAQIAATDRQIDELVFGLYGLSEEERKVILNS